MKFTSEDLAKAMGLKVGDRIKVNWAKGNKIYKITDYYELRDQEDFYIRLTEIVNQEYEILPRKKKVGEQTCKEVGCTHCPLYKFMCRGNSSDDLYTILSNNYKDDKEAYDLLKARLDKEIEV